MVLNFLLQLSTQCTYNIAHNNYVLSFILTKNIFFIHKIVLSNEKKFSLSINCSQMKKFNKLMIFKVTFCIFFNNIRFLFSRWTDIIVYSGSTLAPPLLDLRVQMLVPAGKWKGQCFNFMHCVRLIFLNQFSLDVFIP